MHHRRLTSTAFVIALITTLLLPGGVSAADSGEVESLRNEVRQLQSQLQALRSAVAEATELEGRRSANLARQMREQPPQSAAVAETLPPTSAAEPPAPAREARALPAAAASEKPTARAKRRNKHSTRARAKTSRARD